jgi:hypothetical protein
MDTRTVIAFIVAAVAVVVAAAIIIARRRRSELLRQHFGPEYDRTLRLHGDAARGEAVLLERERRVKDFSLRPLSPSDRERYVNAWASVQRRFVDDPSSAVTQADKLITAIMAERGYPVGDFDQRAADISVHYPVVVQNYRSASDISRRHARGLTTTEELRQAMVHYRSLFDELLETSQTSRIERLAS